MRKLHKLTKLVRQYWQSRPLILLVAGLPALVACLLGMAVVIRVLTDEPAVLEYRYADIARRSYVQKDFETARVAYGRLLALNPSQQQKYSFEMAFSLAGLKRLTEARNLIASLAPFEKPGFPPAHMYVAKSLLIETNATAANLRSAEVHLRRALEVEADNSEAHELLGRIYTTVNLWELAVPHLKQVKPMHGDIMLLLAAANQTQQDPAGMRVWAKMAADYFSEQVDKTQKEDPPLRLGWAKALIMLNDYKAAIAELQRGQQELGGTNSVYTAAMGDVYAAWLGATPARDLTNRFSLVQRGLQVAPQNGPLLRELVSLTQLKGDEAKVARGILNRMLAQEGGQSPMLHYCLGIDSWQRGEVETARRHFALAFDLAPQSPIVANNLAVVLATGDKPDPARALEIIQPIIEKYPGNPRFLDTRGGIYLKLGRYHEAVKDLETALPAITAKKGTHGALAEAYRKLGMKDLAAEHEKLAEQN